MENWRSILAGLIVVLLTVTLVSANLVTFGQRTVLDEDFVTTALEEEGFYGEVQGQVGSAVSEGLGSDGAATGGIGGSEIPVSPEDVVEKSLTEEYLKSQLEPSVESVIGYLHGEQGTLNLTIDLTPVKDNLGEAVEAEVTNMSGSELLSAAGGGLNASDVEVSGSSVDISMIESMEEGPEEYSAARAEFRSQIRSQAVKRLVDQTMEAASDDELLALVVDGYDPTAYSAAEKEEMVADRESKIRSVLREEIRAQRGDEIDTAVEDRMSEIRDALKEQVNATVSQQAGNASSEVRSGMSALLGVYVDGLTTDTDFEAFSSEVEAAKSELAAAIGSAVQSSLEDEVPDEMDISEAFTESELQQLESAREVVGILDILVLALPLLALLLAGAIYGVSRSVPVTLAGSGASLVVAGGSGSAASIIGREQVRAIVSGTEIPEGLASLLTGFVGRIMDVLLTQSLAMLVTGLVLLGLGLAVYRGYVSLPDVGSGESGGGGDEAG